jgi:myo-inositol-1(or 4)-monophosphatase
MPRSFFGVGQALLWQNEPPVAAQDPDALLRLAARAAEEAGALLLEGYRSRPTAREKQPKDLVTEYDLRSEALIGARLRAATPGIAFLAEEGGGERAPGLTWCCDPLDGTTNYVHGHPFWAVSIGLMDGWQPVLGAVVAPALGLRWEGHASRGSTRNGRACRVSETGDLAQALVATGFPADRSRAPDNNLDTFTRVIQHVQGIRRCGSAALDCCLVADGTYDAYWERQLNVWDLAGGVAIALGAGATLTNLEGGEADLNVGHLVLSNGPLHPLLLSRIAGT